MQHEERKSPNDSEAPYPLQQNTVMDPPDFLPNIPTYSTIHDSSVPFPRTSGARFCGAGMFKPSLQKPSYSNNVIQN